MAHYSPVGQPETRMCINNIEFQPMSIGDASYLYDLCEATMRGYVEEVWGLWNEDKSREFLTVVGIPCISGQLVISTYTKSKKIWRPIQVFLTDWF